MLSPETVKRDFYEMGEFHDARIEAIAWFASKASLHLSLEDLYHNFQGLPEYPGPQSGTLEFFGVSDFKIELSRGEPLFVSDLAIALSESEGRGIASLTFRPSGRLSFAFEGARYPVLALKQ